MQHAACSVTPALERWIGDMLLCVFSISAGAATTPPIKFQNVKEIYRAVVLKSLWNFTHLANLLKFMLWSNT